MCRILAAKILHVSILIYDQVLASFTIFTTSVPPRRQHSPLRQNADLNVCQKFNLPNHTITAIEFAFATAVFAYLESSDNYRIA